MIERKENRIANYGKNMSVSDLDFSLSSPRKGQRSGRGDKSITYDEEFEKFLNDVSYC